MSNNASAAAAKGKGPGCFFYGCLTSIILLILLILVSYFAFRSFVYGITDDKPLTFESVETTEQDFQQVNEKITKFGELLNSSAGPHSIQLTEDEINTLIAYHPKLTALRDTLRVKLEGDKIGGSLSVSLGDTVGIFSGRYVNGTAVFRVNMGKNGPDIRVESFEFNGSPVDKSILAEINKSNLVDELKSDPDTKRTVARIRSISVQNGTLHLELEGDSKAEQPAVETPIAAPQAEHDTDLDRAQSAAGVAIE